MCVSGIYVCACTDMSDCTVPVSEFLIGVQELFFLEKEVVSQCKLDKTLRQTGVLGKTQIAPNRLLREISHKGLSLREATYDNEANM